MAGVVWLNSYDELAAMLAVVEVVATTLLAASTMLAMTVQLFETELLLTTLVFTRTALSQLVPLAAGVVT